MKKNPFYLKEGGSSLKFTFIGCLSLLLSKKNFVKDFPSEKRDQG